MSYFLPYARSEGGKLRNDRQTDNNERLMSHVTKYHVPNTLARKDRENEWSDKQVAGDQRRGVSSIEIKNGLDTINSQINCLVQSVARLEHSNQLLWEKFGLLEKPPGATRVQRSPVCTSSPSESPQRGRSTEAVATRVHPDCPLHGREKERLSPNAADNMPFVRVACSPNSPVPPFIYIGKATSGEVRVTETDVFAPREPSRWRSRTGTPPNLPLAPVMSEEFEAETAERRYKIVRDEEVCSSSGQNSPVVRTSGYTPLPIAPPPSIDNAKRDDACSPINCPQDNAKRSVSVGTSDFDRVAGKPPTSVRDPLQQPSGQESIAKRLPMIVDSIEAHRIRLKHPKSTKTPDTGTKSRTNDKEQVFKVSKPNITTSSSTSSGENLPPAPVSKRLSKSQEALPARPSKRQLWNIQPISPTSSRSSADGGSNGNDTSPTGTPKVSPGVRPPLSNTSRCPRTTVPGKSFQHNRNANEEAKQPDFVAMVLEELATTEQNYVHTLSQFLILRDEVFAPNWKINRQKFIRLFPAAIDDLYNLHRVASGKMKLALDRSETSQSRSRSMSGDRSERSICPFRVLADMIDGRQPLGYATHTHFASYYHGVPAWSVAPFFRLYMRYLSEFSLAMQALSEMRHGSSTLKRNLKKLQRHPACELRDITAYLLAPVQRLPRYLLLVKKLIYYTAKNEPPAPYRIKAGLRKREYGPENSAIVGPSCPIPTHPSLESLRRAESALHGMLLELDEMVGVEMAGLCGRQKSTDNADPAINEVSGASCAGASGGSGDPRSRSSSFTNNCSDSVDGQSTSNVTAACLKPRKSSLTSKSRKKTAKKGAAEESRNTNQNTEGGFWQRLKRFRLITGPSETSTSRQSNKACTQPPSIRPKDAEPEKKDKQSAERSTAPSNTTESKNFEAKSRESGDCPPPNDRNVDVRSPKTRPLPYKRPTRVFLSRHSSVPRNLLSTPSLPPRKKPDQPNVDNLRVCKQNVEECIYSTKFARSRSQQPRVSSTGHLPRDQQPAMVNGRRNFSCRRQYSHGNQVGLSGLPRVTLTDYTVFPSDTHEVLSTSSRASSVNDSDSGINLTTDEEKEAASNGQHRSRLAVEEKQESSASPSPSSSSSSSSFSYSKISNPLIRQISLEIREASLLRGNSRQHCARITGILLPGAGNSVSRQIQRSITDLDNTQLQAADNDDEDCPIPAVVGVCSPPLRPPVEITEVSEDSADVQVGELCLDELYQSMVGQVRR